jgi:uncharacterized protein with FMN-binding domain
MKKLLLSLGVIAVFVVYTIMQRHQAASIVIAPPSSSSQTKSTGQTTPTTPASTSTTTTAASYKDGAYTSQESNAFYGNIKLAVTISGGKITAVKFLEYPNDNPNSISINQQAIPLLQQEAIQAQSANVNVISGATDTSQAFIQSLSSVLSQAS